MVDVNGHFDLDEAIAFSHDIAKHNVFWFEEPVGQWNFSELKR